MIASHLCDTGDTECKFYIGNTLPAFTFLSLYLHITELWQKLPVVVVLFTDRQQIFSYTCDFSGWMKAPCLSLMQ